MSYTSVIAGAQQSLSLTTSTTKATLQANVSDVSMDVNALSEKGPLQDDRSKLSFGASLLTKALTEPDTRSERIGSLQQAIATGTYSVPASDIADKLLQSMVP